VERVTMGPEKKSRKVSKKEKESTAYHEAGHALLSLYLDEVDTFTKVSIIPRGMAGGYTLTPPTEDKYYFNKKDLKGMMVVMLGGLVAEQIKYGDTTTGVSNDLQRVAQIARSMVCKYGMSEELGTLAYEEPRGGAFLGRDLMSHKEYSGHTAKLIDEEIRKLVDEAYQRARKLLTEHRDHLDRLAIALVEKEVMDVDETRELLGLPPEPSREEEADDSTDQGATDNGDSATA
ncbi:MAG: cell division protein FtsH, partial [Candidatus Omnitrophica bacterium]|nr:cell division protein FtsH [Candidatus Omnitrophota bacterium]